MNNYEERKKKVGERIKREREALGLKPKPFLFKISMSVASTKTLTAWERGDRLPDLNSLAIMADIFDCDIGYLLGDYDAKRRITADVQEQTGLSEQAINKLLDMGNTSTIPVDVLSLILEDSGIEELLYKICESAQRDHACSYIKTLQKEATNNPNPAKLMQAKIAEEELKIRADGTNTRVNDLFIELRARVKTMLCLNEYVREQGARFAINGRDNEIIEILKMVGEELPNG